MKSYENKILVLAYHILLGRPWTHEHIAKPSTYHQCLKVMWKGKVVSIPAFRASFEYYEAYMDEVSFFDEFTENRENVIAKPNTLALPKWKDQAGISKKKDYNECSNKKHPREEKELKCVKVTIPNGKMAYCLWRWSGSERHDQTDPTCDETMIEDEIPLI